MCKCIEFCDIEFLRTDVTKRIKQTPSLKKELTLVAKSIDKRHKLYCCTECQQLWQCSGAWNWGAKDYLFKVPAIALDDWLNTPYVSPSDLMEFGWGMQQYLSNADHTPSPNQCAVDDCDQKSVNHSVLCLKHHVESLQKCGQLSPNPEGRWFGPYKRENCIPIL